MKRIHVAAAAALVLLVVPTTTGCFNGLKATTTMQATMNSGNGTDATKGPLHIEAATVVIGPDGSNSATLTTRIVNTGAEQDALTYATVNGQQTWMTPDSGTLDPGSSVSFGFDSQAWINAYDFTGTVATYVPVELGFRDAGLVTMSVLVVPAVGYYEGIVPTPPTKPAAG